MSEGKKSLFNEETTSERLIFEEQIRLNGFVKMSRNESSKSRSVYYIDYERLDMYIIRRMKKSKYIVFFKASERAIATKVCECSSEKEAYEALLKISNKE